VVAISAVELSEVIWRIVPLETPRILRYCAKCREVRQFASSDKFRLNAQQHKVDVWLIYKCVACDSTWNCTIIARRTAKEIGAVLYPRFQRNDKELAWACAFDFGLLARQGVQVDSTVEVQGECSMTDCTANGQRPRRIRLELPYPGVIRLDRLLSAQLQVSRSRVHDWFTHGGLQIWPEEKQALRKPARDGQIISLRWEE